MKIKEQQTEFNGGYFRKLHEDKTIFSRSSCLPVHCQNFFKGRNPEYLILLTLEKLLHGVVKSSHLQRSNFSCILPLIFSITQLLTRVDLLHLWADTSFFHGNYSVSLNQKSKSLQMSLKSFCHLVLDHSPVFLAALQWHSAVFSMEKCPPLNHQTQGFGN